MKIAKLKESIEVIKENAGFGLLSVDVFGEDGLSIAGYNSNPQASALFTRIFGQLIKTLKSSGFPPNLDYYTLMLEDKKCVVVGKIGETTYLYGLLVNLEYLQLGLLLNVVIPEFLAILKESFN